MEEEAVRGPVVLFADDKEHNESEDDDGEINNKKLPACRMSYNEIAELQFKEILASDENETDEDDNDYVVEGQPEKKHKKKDLYCALLQSGNGSDEDDEDGQDMEVTFNTGLEDESDTMWEAWLWKSREKKARRNSSKHSTDHENSDSDQEPKEDVDDFFIEETSVKGSKEGHSRKQLQKEKQAWQSLSYYWPTITEQMPA
ncbi:hypothetical protein Acr_01g0002150 [Actinidia rufa]|uniref:Uncharacterized protein n=1 Tax=Actinidia rufa TaxID=165716 RepID=A0A7J0E2Q3_9ERIC|nr:hypothetical protein Acr_01g0002150 [Actinidia rufa]